MTTPAQQRDPLWAGEEEATFLRRRIGSFWNDDYLERIVLPLLALPHGAAVLDVGSGYGALTLLLARLRPDAAFTGIDLEPKAVADATASAARLGLANLRFAEGDAHRLPYPPAAFDAVVCQTLLTHVADAGAVVREMVRILKPAGAFLAVEYHNMGVFSGHDNVVEVPDDEAAALERFRLARLVLRGKRALGRGDETVGVRVPFLAAEGGLRVVDVRRNDRAWHAFPPYHKPNERLGLETMRDFAKGMSERQRAWYRECLLAGGGTEADVARFFEQRDVAAEKGVIRDALEEGRYAYVSSSNVYLTFARKEGTPAAASAWEAPA